MEVPEDKIQVALKHYENTKKAKKAYYLRNSHKWKEYGKTYFQKLKEDPERYALYLEKNRSRYKPKNKKNEEEL